MEKNKRGNEEQERRCIGRRRKVRRRYRRSRKKRREELRGKGRRHSPWSLIIWSLRPTRWASIYVHPVSYLLTLLKSSEACYTQYKGDKSTTLVISLLSELNERMLTTACGKYTHLSTPQIVWVSTKHFFLSGVIDKNKIIIYLIKQGCGVWGKYWRVCRQQNLSFLIWNVFNVLFWLL